MKILSVKTHHCSLKMRFTYYFEVEVNESHLQAFSNMKLQINRFSQNVAGARDTFSLVSEGRNKIQITGLLGAKQVDVFIGRLSSHIESNDDLTVQKNFEDQLTEAGFGDQIHHLDRSQQENAAESA